MQSSCDGISVVKDNMAKVARMAPGLHQRHPVNNFGLFQYHMRVPADQQIQLRDCLRKFLILRDPNMSECDKKITLGPKCGSEAFGSLNGCLKKIVPERGIHFLWCRHRHGYAKYYDSLATTF